jgi:H+/gluconate symporter-like permease
MIILIKVAAIVLALLYLIKKKWDLGLVLFLDSVLTGLLFNLDIKIFAKNVLSALMDGETLSLIGIVVLVLYLGHFLKISFAIPG